MFKNLEIYIDNLYLRPLNESDLDLIWEGVSDPETSKYMAWTAHKNKEETLKFIQRVENNINEESAITWGIFCEKKFCGIVSLISFQRKHHSITYNKAELAYWLLKGMQGKGIMTKACWGVMDYAFTNMNLHKIVVSHFDVNKESENLIKRLGFNYIGTQKDEFCKNEVWFNHVLYEMLKETFYEVKNKVNQKKENFNYVCPYSKSKLFFDVEKKIYTNKDNLNFYVTNDIANFIYPINLEDSTKKVQNFYETRVDNYDKYLHLTFKTHNVDENECRKSFIEKLELKKDSKVLEIACGTGRDSVLIADYLEKEGELTIQDISQGMLEKAKEKLINKKAKVNYCLSNANFLPFPDKYFDSVYSFGGLGEFEDIRKCLEEMVRVTKVGGKIVVGDESIPIWLRETKFAKILTKTNPQFQAELPLKEIPVEARDVCLRWVIGGVFYLLEFKVGEGEPKGNFDFDIPGERGGTYRTRYEGELEGVKPETKKLLYEVVRKNGVSVHDWLDNVVNNAATKELNKL